MAMGILCLTLVACTVMSNKPSKEPIVYGTPLVITKRGTYSGNWESKDFNIAAVTIKTSDPVIIEKCHVRGTGTLITTRVSAQENQSRANVTVRNCYGHGVPPSAPDRAPGMFFIAVWFDRVDIENNHLEGTRGIWLVGQGKAGAQKKVKVLRNRAKNIDGRTTGGVRCGPANPQGFISNNGMCGASFVQIGSVLKVPDMEVGWNEVINEPYKSHVEDIINIYNSSGTANSPLLIHDNYIQGAYPANPVTDSYTGSGINAGDSDNNVTADMTSAYVRAYKNQVVSTANVGMFIAAGHDSQLYNNRVVSSGYLSDGKPIKNHFTGMYVWDCCYNLLSKSPPVFYNNYAYKNTLGYAYIGRDGKPHRSDSMFDNPKFNNCSTNSNGTSKCTRNQSLPEPITANTEKGELQRWRDKISINKILIGPERR